MKKIADWLTADGVKPASGVWWARSIAGLIKNPVYKGHRCKQEVVPPDEVEERDSKAVRYRYGSSWVVAPRLEYGKTIHHCEPLVDAAIWKRANEALATRPKRGHTDRENRAMLAEALSCPFCEDSPMYRHRSPSEGRILLYYRCTGRGNARRSCGNMVRMELVDAAVNEVMASTFDIPVMEHVIVYGNEADIEAELERINFELKQLAAQGLPWDEEDRERARLRTEHERVANTELIDDRVELVETGDTYLELWERLDPSERGPWLVEHGVQVTASKDRVTVTRGSARGVGVLDPPEPAARNTELVYQGKCGCGCGTDIYGGIYGQKKRYVDGTHRKRAYRQRAAVGEG